MTTQKQIEQFLATVISGTVATNMTLDKINATLTYGSSEIQIKAKNIQISATPATTKVHEIDSNLTQAESKNSTQNFDDDLFSTPTEMTETIDGVLMIAQGDDFFDRLAIDLPQSHFEDFCFSMYKRILQQHDKKGIFTFTKAEAGCDYLGLLTLNTSKLSPKLRNLKNAIAKVGVSFKQDEFECFSPTDTICVQSKHEWIQTLENEYDEFALFEKNILRLVRQFQNTHKCLELLAENFESSMDDGNLNGQLKDLWERPCPEDDDGFREIARNVFLQLESHELFEDSWLPACAKGYLIATWDEGERYPIFE